MSLFGAIKRRVSPLHKVMRASDYWRAKRYPKFTEGLGKVHGQAIRFSDPVGFLHSVEEIFYGEVYRFKSRNSSPFIIDAGANIGLSIMYFKRLFPDARIIAYEPDKAIFQLLASNVSRMKFENVDLRNAAAWIENTTLTFYSEGSLAGSTEIDFLSKGEASVVRAERLRDILTQMPVDFLKIDIEGAENSLLFDIKDMLGNVDHLFFEYHSQPLRPQRLGELLELVRQAGFRFTINGAHAPRYPFVDRVSKGFDLQLNVSCFRN